MHPHNSSPSSAANRQRYAPLLAILALVLASLACINSELNLVVKHEENQVDTLEVKTQRYMYESWVAAANEINQEMAADFAAAGRTLDPGNLLPVVPDDFGELLNPQEYKDQGYDTTSTDRGFSASKTFTLDQERSADDWKVKIIQNPDHPEQITYRAKIFLDLTNLKGSLFELRNQPLPDKPNLTPGSASGLSGNSFGGLGGLFEGMTQDAENELAIEMWYIQKAMQKSDPIEYTFSIELPGMVVLHQLDGQTAGTVEGNQVTLILDESALMANAGKILEFHVESILKDCSRTCDLERHMIWDGDEQGVDCNCLCESGWTLFEGTTACTHCDEICRWSDPNFVRDLDRCTDNQCACTCQEGMVLNQAGTACITHDEYDAWLADLERSPEGGPSALELGLLFGALLDPDNDKNINEMPGWFLLTSGEREHLLQFLQTLGLAVDRSQLVIYLGPEMSTEDRIKRLEMEQNRLQIIQDLAIAQVEEQIKARRTVQNEIIKEIGGKWGLGQYAVKLPDYLQKIWQAPRELATEYIKEQLTDNFKNRILEETHGGSPEDLEAAAADLVKKIPYLATNGCVDDYYLYKKYYNALCPNGCEGDDASLAHETALDQLQKSLEENIYGAGRINWSKPGEAYDRAFWTLNIKINK